MVFQRCEDASEGDRFGHLEISAASVGTASATQGRVLFLETVGIDYVDSHEEVDHIHREDSPNDDAEVIAPGFEEGLQRSEERLAFQEVIPLAEFGKW